MTSRKSAKDTPRELVGTVHVHQRDEATGQVLQSVIVDNRNLRKVLKAEPWVADELDKPESAHVWRDIPASEDADDEDDDQSAKDEKLEATPPPNAFGPGVGDGNKDVDLDKPSKSAAKGEWMAYADSIGLTVGADATRADIIDAVERTQG